MTSPWDQAFDQRPPEDVPAAPPVSEDSFKLLFNGRLTDRVEYGGHTFGLRTLSIGEELRVTEIIKPYINNDLAQGRAYATAVVAASLTDVDGEPFGGIPLGPADDRLPRRYDEVSDWNWVFIDQIYQKYLELEQRQAEAVEEVDKKKGMIPSSSASFAHSNEVDD